MCYQITATNTTVLISDHTVKSQRSMIKTTVIMCTVLASSIIHPIHSSYHFKWHILSIYFFPTSNVFISALLGEDERELNTKIDKSLHYLFSYDSNNYGEQCVAAR